MFYEIEELSVKEAEKLEDIGNKVLIEDAVDPDKGVVVARAFEPLSKAVVKQIAELGVNKIQRRRYHRGRRDRHQVHEEGSRPRTRKRRSRIFIAASVRAIRRPPPTPAR